MKMKEDLKNKVKAMQGRRIYLPLHNLIDIKTAVFRRLIV